MRGRFWGLSTSTLRAFAGAGLILSTALPVAIAVGVPAALAEPRVTGMRVAEKADGTRLVLDLTERVQFSVFTLDNPYRVVLDLPVVSWGLAAGGGERSLGVIARFRYGRFDEDTSRMVLDLNSPAAVASAFVLPPGAVPRYRLVLDLRPVSAARFVVDERPLPEAAPSDGGVIPGVQGKIVVVLDPGHGGVDPGAIGLTGAREKDITLAISRELGAALEATGRYQVVLTRNSDRFVALRERVRIAREAEADLFLSLHADSLEFASVRGASVYTLSEKASDKEAEKLAAKENRADVIGGLDLRHQNDDVATILISLAQRESMNLSATFANLLIPEFVEDWRLLRNTHRFAGFAVLKAPDVPSVLVELGYLSNAQDERALSSGRTRKPIVVAVVRAVNRYFDSLPD